MRRDGDVRERTKTKSSEIETSECVEVLSLPRSSLIRLLQTSSAVVHRLTLNAYVQEKERFEEEEQPQEVHRNVMIVGAIAFLPILGLAS